MTFLEKELEDIIWESDNENLQEKGLNIHGNKIRQLRIGNYGIADLITIQRNTDFDGWCYTPYIDITVFELKKDQAGISAFLQSVRYCKGIKRFLESKKPKLNFKLHIVLIGKEVDTKGGLIFLTDLINDGGMKNLCSLNFYSCKYNIDGLFFKQEEEYQVSNENFKI